MSQGLKTTREGRAGIVLKKGGYLHNIVHHPMIYAMALPVILYYAIFHYGSMYGITMAFVNYVPTKTIWTSQFVGLQHFRDFFTGPYFGRLVRNTLMINLKELIFAFPVPILFALLLNEVRSRVFQRVAQSITYIPHFISSVVICGLLVTFSQSNGILTDVFVLFGAERVNLLTKPEYFQGLFIGMLIWSSMGWDSIIYFAALTGIDTELYDAAHVDGARRLQQAVHVTLPGILPTIMVMLILRIGSMMSVSWDMVVNLYNPMTYETADVLSTYVYRMGLTRMQYSFATAAGLFNSVVNIALLILANTLSRRMTENSLW